MVSIQARILSSRNFLLKKRSTRTAAERTAIAVRQLLRYRPTKLSTASTINSRLRFCSGWMILYMQSRITSSVQGAKGRVYGCMESYQLLQHGPPGNAPIFCTGKPYIIYCIPRSFGSILFICCSYFYRLLLVFKAKPRSMPSCHKSQTSEPILT